MKDSNNTRRVEKWLKTLGLSDYFACIYGSYARDAATARSDLDVMICVRERDPAVVARVTTSFIGFSREARYPLDAEVPFENKLLVSHADLNAAVELRAFELIADGIHVPPLQKTPSFLSSAQMRWRLALNVLTTPHLVLGPAREQHELYRARAEQALGNVARRLCSDPCRRIDALVGSAPRTGEAFLGYKDYPAIRRHLQRVLEPRTSTRATGVVPP